MHAELTKTFAFSACHTDSGKILGRNYLFSITVEWLSADHENTLSAIVHREILSQVHTRDLGEHVEFLKNRPLDDASILEAFWKRLTKPLAKFRVKRLTLQRDSETSTALWLESSK
jgi:hypothetical protein